MEGGDNIDKVEVALQLTLRALDGGKIAFSKMSHADDSDELKESRNTFNAKQIYEFYNEIYKNLDTTSNYCPAKTI